MDCISRTKAQFLSCQTGKIIVAYYIDFHLCQRETYGKVVENFGMGQIALMWDGKLHPSIVIATKVTDTQKTEVDFFLQFFDIRARQNVIPKVRQKHF